MNNSQKLVLGENGLTLGGRDFYLASGDMHYFRFFKEGWRRRLKLMKDFGLTCVQTYVPWNLHEPQEGEFDFSGNLDLAAVCAGRRGFTYFCARRLICARNGISEVCPGGF